MAEASISRVLPARHRYDSPESARSLKAENAKLRDVVSQLTREKRELYVKNCDLKLKVNRYEEHTRRLHSLLRSLKAPLDFLSSHSAGINDVLSFDCDAGCSKENTSEEPEPQPEGKQRALTAKVMPMIDGIPIRRIKIPLQRLEDNPARHRVRLTARASTGGVRWHRQQRQQPRGADASPRRVHRAPRTPSSGQGHIIRHRNGGGPMLEAVVLLRRLSLTPPQLRRQHLSATLRSPVVMLQDISTSLQNMQGATRISGLQNREAPAQVPNWSDHSVFESASTSSSSPEARVNYEQSTQSFTVRETVSETEVTCTQASSSAQDSEPSQVVNTTVSTSCEVAVLSWESVVTQSESAGTSRQHLGGGEEQTGHAYGGNLSSESAGSSDPGEGSASAEVNPEPGTSGAPSTPCNKRRKTVAK